MPTGHVKWFNDQKGFGFIGQESGDGVFVRHSAVQMVGFKSLYEGDAVEFELSEDAKGLKGIRW